MGAQGSKDDGDHVPSPDHEETEAGIVLTGKEDIIQLIPGLSVGKALWDELVRDKEEAEEEKRYLETMKQNQELLRLKELDIQEHFTTGVAPALENRKKAEETEDKKANELRGSLDRLERMTHDLITSSKPVPISDLTSSKLLALEDCLKDKGILSCQHLRAALNATLSS
eukprot:TRINITY_DN680_c2_g1_i2.p1 TRINITY_DN680_c2_g1~~TRINITY_DN680_c2_g1_i2.p1  ORF type:complete len:170 (+),score=70.91 TRINITY_DN680_c2_g1_i2:75-584(+)